MTLIEPLGYLFFVDFPEAEEIPENIIGKRMVYHDNKTGEYRLDNMRGEILSGKARKIAEAADKSLE